ncbi:MAG: molybdopterin [Geobacteraceae bacterium]|nr:MAG: molybdopterin [Geobacteraceae bacterium]
MVSLTIDGKNTTVARGTTILDAASTVGIKIPTLCWLQKVSPTGACRVCAVEIEGVERPMTACNTPVKEGIKVTTQSERLSAIRRKVTELLLVNHPLDCPVCDAGGECDLQDACYGLDVAKQEYSALLERRKIRYDWPLIESDPNRCILCEKCVKVDHEIVGADAIAVTNCGEATVIETADGKPLNCEFCGNCVAACPTGTLISKPFKFKGRPWTYTVTKSVCAFCSAGCQIEYHTKEGRVDRVTSDDGTFNSGNLCINGRFGYSYLNSPERLTVPLVREEGGQVKADWERAMSVASRKLQEIVKNSGPDAVAGISSPRVTNEDNFLFQKLLRVAVGTNNIDSEARLGYAVAQKALMESLGLTGASATIDRIDSAAAVLVFGADLNAESAGVEYRVIKAATKNDAKLVLANMRGVKLKKFANSHLQYRPGGELALINGLMKVILEEGLEDKESVQKVNGLDGLKKGVGALSLSDLAAASGVAEADLREAARLIGGKKSIAVLFGADLMRSAGAFEKVTALANLALLTGAVGKEAGGLFPVDEKNNTQGLLDMGAAPDHLPGYQSFDAAAPAFAKAWGKELPTGKGKDLWQIIEGIEQGSIKALYLLGSDPLVSFPDNGRIGKALAKLELLIVQDIFPSESVKHAHVVFPAAAAAEKTGTFTTSDGRVQCLGKAVNPPGAAREDLDIIAELFNRLASQKLSGSPVDVLDEIKRLVPLYAGECRMVDGRCTGTIIQQPALKGAALSFAPVASAAAGASAGPALLAGPILFHSGTVSTRSENNLTVAREGYIEISVEDAAKLGVSDGGSIKVTSPVGSVTGKARVSAKVQPGLLFAPYHFRGLNVNALLEKGSNLAGVKVEKA